MTAELDVAMQGDGKWVSFPVWEDDDPQPWAESVVDGYLQRRRVRCTPPERMVVVQAWAAMAEDVRARRQDDERWMAAAYGFVPMGSEHAGDLVAMTVAHLSGVQDATGRDAFVDGLIMPPSQRLGEPLVEEIATASGDALRVRQLLVDPWTDEAEGVGLSLVYAWESPLPWVVVVLDAWFGLADEAMLVLPSFDALAATLTMKVA